MVSLSGRKIRNAENRGRNGSKSLDSSKTGKVFCTRAKKDGLQSISLQLLAMLASDDQKGYRGAVMNTNALKATTDQMIENG